MHAMVIAQKYFYDQSTSSLICFKCSLSVAPGLTTELQQTSPIANNSSSEAPCNLYDITIRWTPPTNTGGQGVLIDYYLVSVSGPDGYTCPPDQCNVTTTNTTLTGIVCNTSHIVSVRAVNCAGSSNDSESMEIFIIELPSEPTPTIATTPSPTSESITPSPTSESITPSPTSESITPSPTSESITPSPTSESITCAPVSCNTFWALLRVLGHY